MTPGGPPFAASLFELAPEGVYLAAGCPAVARGLLPHDFTFAAPAHARRRGAGGGPCLFCGTFPGVAPGGG